MAFYSYICNSVNDAVGGVIHHYIRDDLGAFFDADDLTVKTYVVVLRHTPNASCEAVIIHALLFVLRFVGFCEVPAAFRENDKYVQ